MLTKSIFHLTVLFSTNKLLSSEPISTQAQLNLKRNVDVFKGFTNLPLIRFQIFGFCSTFGTVTFFGRCGWLGPCYRLFERFKKKDLGVGQFKIFDLEDSKLGCPKNSAPCLYQWRQLQNVTHHFRVFYFYNSTETSVPTHIFGRKTNFLFSIHTRSKKSLRFFSIYLMYWSNVATKRNKSAFEELQEDYAR